MSKAVNINRNVLFLEDWFDKSFAKMPSPVSFAQMEAYFIDGGSVQDFCTSDG